MPDTTNMLCVCGAGTMGAGIAQAAAQAGIEVILYDVNNTILQKATGTIQHNLQQLVAKQKITATESADIYNRILFTGDIQQCRAAICIEAIIEKTAAKVALLQQLANINTADTILASNTSSLSITAIQQLLLPNPERFAGMHFFNPATVMKLVELVKGAATSTATIEALRRLCVQMHKVPVLCNDTPGFIVNRVARHYYLEAMKLVETGIAGIEAVDAIMESTGFKMGPFKLMDMIGLDVNLAVSESIYAAFNQAERFKPSALQQQKVQQGALGRKSGKGFYTY
ncbi:MAG TPA: 3-hydroxyacyl-CoA dehydrogenase NAD-binding domain-containing protein [Ferruginibacter sp.]|nr:3-hydroxyacyl-CoA dehydrogenase NAD-binding domain-containing protein [Ferruginibacter sp.]HMP20698.1 3-hydroxyacyl-CoA dehydrogenase NAD-binding domain-containing protein [Ferruginibacter sp.]